MDWVIQGSEFKRDVFQPLRLGTHAANGRIVLN